MADNAIASAAIGVGETFALAQLSFSGDTVKLPVDATGILSGSEGAWTYTLYVGGAGAVTAGVQRMTLASDDPAVSALGATADAAATQGSTGSISAKLRTVTSQLNTIADGIPVTNAGTFAVQVSSIASVPSHAVTNAGTFVVQVDGTALTRLTDIETNTDSCAVIGNGAAATAQRVTLANDSTGIVALTTSTASIGKLASNTGVTIGAVEIAAAQTLSTVTTVSTVTAVTAISTSVTPGTSAGASGKAEDAVHGSGDTGVLMLGVRADVAASTATSDGDYTAPTFDSTGRLWCNVSNTLTVNSHAVTIDAGAVTSLALIDDPVIQDDAGFTPATSKVMMAGFQADETATDSVDEGDAGAARMTLDRKVITSPQPHTAGGLSISRDIDLDNSTLTVVKNAPGQLYGYSICNTSTATVFVKFYDATSGTYGTGTPVLTIGIPGNATDDTLVLQSFGGLGIVFATGICVGAGTGVADADTADPGANAVVANIYYK